MFPRRPFASLRRRPVLIDTDTGVDDALALCLAFRSPEIEVVGVTTVAGNVEVNRCTRNVFHLCRLLGLEHPPRVVAGAPRPLVLPLVTAPEVHGRGGMGRLTPSSAPPIKSSASQAARFISSAAETFGPDLTIVALGPLTNIAAAFLHAPSSLRQIGRIVSMGGAFNVPGNTGPVAEFNYFVDPNAVQSVVNLASNLLVVPLDVTEQAILSWSVVERRSRDRRVGWMRELLKGYMEYHALTEGFLGAYLHDPVAMAEAIQPGILHSTETHIGIVSRDGPARGLTTLEPNASSLRRHIRVAQSYDAGAFFRLFERIWTRA